MISQFLDQITYLLILSTRIRLETLKKKGQKKFSRMSTMINAGLSTFGFLQLPGEVRTIVYHLIYDGLKEDDEQWAINSLKISRSWYNEAMLIIVSNVHHTITIRFNSL